MTHTVALSAARETLPGEVLNVGEIPRKLAKENRRVDVISHLLVNQTFSCWCSGLRSQHEDGRSPQQHY